MTTASHRMVLEVPQDFQLDLAQLLPQLQ